MDFERAQKSYNKNAVVQFEMAKKMASMIEQYAKAPEKILEIGPGTGFLTEHLFRLFDCEIFLNDINRNQTKFSPKEFILGDIMEVALPKNFDLIAANAVFQWIEKSEKLFRKLNESLNQKGMLVFSTFGKENYKQFKNYGGIKYLDIDELGTILSACGFEIYHIEEQIFTLYFETPREILKHIRNTGVSTFNRYGLWTKSALDNFEKEYIENFQDSNGVGLTYHPIFCICNKL